MERYSVTAVLSAIDNGFTSSIDEATKSVNNLDMAIKHVTASILNMAREVAAFNSVNSSVAQLKDSFQLGSKEVEHLSKVLKEVIEQVTSVQEKVTGFGKNAMDWLGKTASSMSKLVPDDLFGKITTLGGQVSKLGSKFLDMLPTSVIKNMTSIGIVGSNVVQTIQSKMPGLAGAFQKVTAVLGSSLKIATNTGMGVLSTMTSALTQVVGVAIKAVGPTAIVGMALVGLGMLQNMFGEQLNDLIYQATTEGPNIIAGLIDGLVSKIPDLIATGTILIVNLLGAITANLPVIMEGGMAILTSLIQGVIDSLPQLIPAIITVVTTFIKTIIEMLPQIIKMGLQILLALVNGILDNMDFIMESVQSIFTTLTNAIINHLPDIINMGIQILLGLVEGIVKMLPQIVIMGIEMLTVLIATISECLPFILEAGVEIIMSLIRGIVDNFPDIAKAALDLIVTLIEAIVTNLPTLILAGFDIILALIFGIVEMLPDLLKYGWEIIKALAMGIIKAIPELISAVLNWIGEKFSNLWSWITGGAKDCAEDTEEEMQKMMDGMENTTAKMSESTTAITSQMSDEVAHNVSDMSTTATNLAEKMNTDVSSEMKDMSTASSMETNAMYNSVSSHLSKTSDASTSSMGTLANTIENGCANAAKAASDSFNQLEQSVQSAMNTIHSASTQGINGLLNTFESAFSKMPVITDSSMKQVASSLVKNLNEAIQQLSTLSTKTTEIGMQVMNGLAAGINNRAPVAIQAARAVANQIAEVMRKALDIHSPSRITRKIGGQVSKGAELGILDHLKDVQKASATLAQAMEPGAISNRVAQVHYDWNQQAAFTVSQADVNHQASHDYLIAGISHAIENRPLQVTSVLNGRILAEETTPAIDRHLGQNSLLQRRYV